MDYESRVARGHLVIYVASLRVPPSADFEPPPGTDVSGTVSPLIEEAEREAPWGEAMGGMGNTG